MKYELDLKILRDGSREYVTPTQKKYFKYALEWCLENNCNSCRVNRTYYNFDFENLKVNINGVGYGNNNTYSIKKVVE